MENLKIQRKMPDEYILDQEIKTSIKTVELTESDNGFNMLLAIDSIE